MIEIRNLSVGFGDRPVLDGISFDIRENETTVIVGASGSGKTVLMKTIEGLFQPWSGSILIDGENFFELDRKGRKQLRQKLSMLFQGAALLDSMNAFQNIALPLVEHSSLSDDEIERLVHEKLDLVGLRDVDSKMPSELSGGMRKRVGLARAIIREPKYIIYDEPTTGLDPIIATEIVSLIRKLEQSLKITSIVITHDLYCIDRIAERVVMLHEGHIAFDGTYDEFKSSDKPAVVRFRTIQDNN